MTPERRLAALEAEDAAAPKTAPDLLDSKFAAQFKFLIDTAALIVVLCTRRAGKSFGAALRLLRAAYKHPGSSCLYIALTRESAEKILWKDCLKVINRRFKLGLKFNESKLSATLPNGSVIYLLGVDTTEEEKEKLLGQKYAEVVVDESASYSIDLVELVFGILKPAVADYRGTVVLIGTPGNLKTGLFFDLTNGQDPTDPGQWQKQGWSGHRWSALDNPYMREKWLAEIADLIAANPLIEETPLFQQNYKGRWVIDESKLVYRYQSGRNDFDGVLPSFRSGSWHYVLGVDTGWKASAFTLVAYHDHCRTLFVLESIKKAGLDITAMSEEVKRFEARFDIERTVIDGANKQAVEEMSQRHGVALEAADKTGKFDFIDLMNDDFIQERVKIDPKKCNKLVAEYANLIVDEKALAKRKREEHPSCENHCADATLYPWRFAYPYLSEMLKKAPATTGTAEWYAEQAASDEAAVRESFEQQLDANREAQRQQQEDAQQWL